MEFAVVNNYMGPIATKAMKGYSDEDLAEDIDDFKVARTGRKKNIAVREYLRRVLRWLSAKLIVEIKRWYSRHRRCEVQRHSVLSMRDIN